MVEILFTEPNTNEAQNIIKKLNTSLESITGDSGKSSYSSSDFSSTTDAFLILKKNGNTIGCGAIRKITSTTCEIKRMYTEKKGYGQKILQALEKKAIELNYNHVVLSTRKVNIGAVNFYQKHNYQKCAPYGKYKNNDRSICFEKFLYA